MQLRLHHPGSAQARVGWWHARRGAWALVARWWHAPRGAQALVARWWHALPWWHGRCPGDLETIL